jgi:hypothetical protein
MPILEAKNINNQKTWRPVYVKIGVKATSLHLYYESSNKEMRYRYFLL